MWKFFFKHATQVHIAFNWTFKNCTAFYVVILPPFLILHASIPVTLLHQIFLSFLGNTGYFYFILNQKHTKAHHVRVKHSLHVSAV